MRDQRIISGFFRMEEQSEVDASDAGDTVTRDEIRVSFETHRGDVRIGQFSDAHVHS